MAETLTIPRVLPIGTILFELLFLLVAIPIEAYVFHSSFKFDKKSSMFYAIVINVLSSVAGWIMFFLLEPILPLEIKSEIINYVLFNTFKSSSIQSFVVLTGFIIFFTTFLFKFSLLKGLLFILNDSVKTEEITLSVSRRERWHINNKVKLLNTNLATTTLIANSLSYTAITLILLIRSK
jgi:hypothetical protein